MQGDGRVLVLILVAALPLAASGQAPLPPPTPTVTVPLPPVPGRASGAAPPVQAPPSSGAVIFRDTFDKPPLNPAWKIDLEDKERWALEGGSLVVVTQPGKAATATEKEVLKNRFILDRTLPPEYTLTARVSVALANGGNVVSLRVRTVTATYVAVGYKSVCRFSCNERWRRPFVDKWVGGQSSLLWGPNRYWDQSKPTQIDLDGFTRKSETIWLRLEKQGPRFIGAYSFDGDRFETIGEHALLNTDGSRVELAVFDESPGIETGAQFDFIEIVR